MSFRILSIRIYSRYQNDSRQVNFNRNGLSIVTGVSRRGKSAILAIIDYLLASGSCSIPRGVVRDAVSYVGGLFERDDGVRMVVHRPVPREGHSGSGTIHVQTGFGLVLPAAPVEGRWNLKSARNRISEFAGIESLPLLTTRSDDDEENFSAANIRHATPFLFQPQDVIASRVVSFPGLEDFWYKRHVLDALDYFLGVFDAELLSIRSELRQLEREQRAAKRKLSEMRKLGADGYDRGQRLLAEAIAVGLAPDGRADSIIDIRRLLRAAFDEEPVSPERITAATIPNEAIENERRARSEYHELQHEIARVEAEAKDAGAHTNVVKAGIERISLRNLLPSRKPGDCPVCGSNELASEDLSAELESAAIALGREQAVPTRLHSEMEKRLVQLRQRAADAASRMKAAQRSLRALFEYLSENRSVLDEIRERERLRGRIESYLDATSDLDDSDAEHTRDLLARISELENRLRAKDSDRRSAQEEIEKSVTEIAQQLEVEFDESARVSIESLIIQIKAGGKWVHLAEFGSGANWVSYHVAAAVGLAQVFASRAELIPKFLVLDQPSQAWFPPDAAEKGQSEPDDDEDRRAVRQLYRVLEEYSNVESGPQIIVMDHAKLSETWFRDRVVEDWHDVGEALVPVDWIPDT